MSAATPSPQVGQSALGEYAPATSYSQSHRPRGVTALAALNFLVAGIYSIFLISTMLEPQPAPVSLAMPSGDFATWLDGIAQDTVRDLKSAQTTALVMSAAINIPLGLLVGIGLWRLAWWGSLLALLSYGANAIYILLSRYSESLTGSALIGIIISIAAFIYLLRPEVRAAFQKPRGLTN